MAYAHRTKRLTPQGRRTLMTSPKAMRHALPSGDLINAVLQYADVQVDMGGGRTLLRANLAAGTRLLVSQEPTGGSPSGAPTGPVVYAGLLVNG